MSPKHITIIFLVVMTAVFLSLGPAVAGTVYLGAHGGKVLLKQGAKDELNEDHFSGGLLVGVDALETKEVILAVEADFAIPLSKGTSEDFGEWKLSTVGLYGGLRLGKKVVYLKIKAGLIYENLEVEAPQSQGADDLGLSLGLGGGFRLVERIFLEIEGVIIDKNMGYLRAGAGYHF